MNNLWTVDPSDEWKHTNQEWLLEANLPGTEQCADTFTGIRCELKAGHSSSHMVHMAQEEAAEESPET